MDTLNSSAVNDAVSKSKERQNTRSDALSSSAGGGGRTHTVSPPTDFESVSSANSNTPARDVAIINALEQKVNPAPLQRYASFVIIAPC